MQPSRLMKPCPHSVMAASAECSFVNFTYALSKDRRSCGGMKQTSGFLSSLHISEVETEWTFEHVPILLSLFLFLFLMTRPEHGAEIKNRRLTRTCSGNSRENGYYIVIRWKRVTTLTVKAELKMMIENVQREAIRIQVKASFRETWQHRPFIDWLPGPLR